MANEIQTAIRLPKDTVVRAGRLAKILATKPKYAAFRMSRSAVLRLALLRGLAALEAEAKR